MREGSKGRCGEERERERRDTRAGKENMKRKVKKVRLKTRNNLKGRFTEERRRVKKFEAVSPKSGGK